MAAYRIVLTDDATEDLTNLRDYIANVLASPGTALSYVRTVRKELASLCEFPARNKTLDEEPWHSLGLRRFLVKSSFVYYRIDEEAKTVYVLNVIYARRDQLRTLNEKSTGVVPQ